MSLRLGPLVAAASLMITSSAAFAAADLVPSVAQPAGVYVYESGTWTVSVANIGNKSASNVSLTIQLPQTSTSPSVYVMGTLGAKSSSCTQSGTRLVCALGSVGRSTSKSVTFAIALPESADPLVISASVTTTSSENSTANNSASATAALDNYEVELVGPVTLTHDHCTGTDLSSYYECSLFPSSISTHYADYADDGTVSFPLYGPEYTGVWWQDTTDHLGFEVYELGVLVAEFEGWGTSASCWEGITTFPGSTYVSPYRVCMP